MTDKAPKELTARWALYSKRQQSFDEYEILADSTGGAPGAELLRFVRRLIPGTPTTVSGGPDALPWITIGPVDLHVGHIGITVMAYPDDQRTDFAGRLIVETRYFDFSYVELAAHEIDYSAMWEAISGASLPLERAVTASPRGIGAMMENGGDWFSLAAALLADRQSVVITGRPPTPVQRLAIIDGVLGLLPWAARASATVGTWFPNLDRTNVTICFGDVVRESHTALALGAGTAPLGAEGQQYLRLLRERINEVGLALVVAGLRRQRGPWPTDKPFSEAIEAAAFQTETDLIRGKLTAANTLWALSVFDERDFAVCFSEETQRAIFTRLLSDAKPTEARLLVPFRMLPSLASSLAEAGLDRSRLEVVREIAIQCGLLTQVARRLLPDAALCVMLLDPLVRRGVDLPEIRAALVQREDLGPAYIARALQRGGPQAMTAWMGWLLQDNPSATWLGPLAAVHRPEQPAATAEALRRFTEPVRGALLVLASDLDRLDALLPQGFELIAQAIQRAPTAAKAIRALPGAGPKAGHAARAAYDVLRAIAGTPGRGMVDLPAREELPAYAAALAAVIGRLAPEVRVRAAVQVADLLSPSGGRPTGLQAVLAEFAAHLGPERDHVLSALDQTGNQH